MRLNFPTIALVSLALLFLASCKRDMLNDIAENTRSVNDKVTHIEEMVVPGGFDYSTTREVNVDISLEDAMGNAFRGVKVSLFDGQFEPGNHPKELYTGFTDANGRLYAPVSLPTYIKEVVVYPFSIGIPNNVTVPVAGTTVKFHYSNGEIQSRILNPTATNSSSNTGGITRKAGIEDVFSRKLGTWDANGKPNYLESQRDVLTSTFLSNITASFPESKPVTINHPDYLLETNERNLHITELSDVWITFVHEGAGYKNSLLYYVYHKDSVPTSTNDIDSLYIVFPNVSFTGSGGSLTSGDKVKLGRFSKDYVIGFALAADGYSWDNNVTKGRNMWFTDKQLNNEAAAYKQHSALLHDGDNDRFIIGFEDLKRDDFSSDEDFNDALFFATSNPVEAIDDSNVPPIDKPLDSDGDGVTDVYDDYPNDATKAYNRYFPSENDYGTLAFEDLWPHTGDYDMNDLVIRMRYHAIANANNKVIELNCKTFATAKGGSFPIGFGVQFPFNATAVSTATGSQITRNRTTLASNGLEQGNTQATFIFFDEAADQMSHPGGSFFNTLPSSGISVPDTIVAKLTFGTPISFADMGTYPFNPFIFINGRDAEVHLPNHANTTLANTNLFSTGKDNSSTSEGRYYKTAGNLPWALHIPTAFEYPIEKTPIIEAYNNFAAWAQSGGTTNEGWYLNETGNRNTAKIFSR